MFICFFLVTTASACTLCFWTTLPQVMAGIHRMALVAQQRATECPFERRRASKRERERRESNCNGLLAWNLQICLEMYVGGFRWASEAERGLLDVEFAEEDQKEPPLVNRGSLLSFAYCSMKKNTRQFINSKHLL